MRAATKTIPPVEELRRLLSYDSGTGALTWVACPKFKGAPGGIAGTGSKLGYLMVGIDRKYYGAHRIIWKMVTGEEPPAMIDHIDGDKANNRWANLRSADNGRNKQNTGMYRNNSSGVKGVCWDAAHKKWRAYISINGTQHKLGRFKNIEQAAAVVASERIRLHGAFARFF